MRQISLLPQLTMGHPPVFSIDDRGVPWVRYGWPETFEVDESLFMLSRGPHCWQRGNKIIFNVANGYAEYVIIETVSTSDDAFGTLCATYRCARLYARCTVHVGDESQKS